MKKKHSIWITILTVALSAALLLGTMTVSAFAAGYDDGNLTQNGDKAAATFIDSMEYGDTYDLSGAFKVITPNGSVVTEDLGSFKATEVGAYTVYFDEGNYSYVVPCKIDEEYELRVAYDGADIPTYVQKNGTFTLPYASIYAESDELGSEYTELTGEGYTVYVKVVNLASNGKILDKDGNEVSEEYVPANGEYKVRLDNPGAYTVHYYCRVKGGTKYVYKDYTVQVQNTFNDAKAPSLTIVALSKEISLNTKITLPKATASDNYDKNVKVTVKVEELNKEDNKYYPVKKVVEFENGYAKTVATGDDSDEVFDNIYNLTFYPTKETTYKVTYSAFDDAGNEVAGVYSYTTTAVDKTAPVLKEIAAENIPTKWGIYSVTNAKGPVEEKAVTFPYPTYVDNSSDPLSVSFEIKDPHKQTVLKVSNILATDGTANKYEYNANSSVNGIYPESVTFTKENGLKVDFEKYANILKEDNKTVTGVYTATYRVSDKRNSASKTYEIEFVEDFVDEDAPDVTVTYTDEYLLFGKTAKDFMIPSPVITDDNDTELAIEYVLSNGSEAAADSITVKGGEVAKLLVEGDNCVLKIENKEAEKEEDKVKSITLTDKLFYKVTVTDDADNSTVVTNMATETTEEKPITVVNAMTLAAPPAPASEDSDDPDFKFTPATYEGLELGKNTVIGSFYFKVPAALREFYGFELSLVKDGELWSAGKVSLETYYKDGKVCVDNITVAAPAVQDESGEFALYVRVFNAAGVSVTTKLNIGTETVEVGDKTTMQAINIPTKGSVYTTYNLKNKTVNVPDDIAKGEEYVVRKILGNGKFSLMGTQFTAYDAGTFTFTDGYYTSVTADGAEFVPFSKNGSYTLTVSESATPVWQLQDEMPSYAAKDSKVLLPKVVATTEYANAEIKVAITDPDSKPLTVATKEGENKDVKIEVKDGVEYYYFTASKNGSYTITYTAYYGDNGQISQSYTLKAGDVTAPNFTVVTAPNARASENEVFEFSEVRLSEEDAPDGSTTRYVKTLIAPDGSTVFTVDGTGDNYRKAVRPTDTTKGYTFTKTGTYTVEYTVYDSVGNANKETFSVTVTAAKVNNPVSTKVISTILIIIGVLLIAGVILYFVRFRKVKAK